ncbi:hypothetical protein BH11PLA2_BH11PLA2_08340 [soil metagenome]
MNTNDPTPCAAFADALNAVLDGDAPANSLTAHPHFAHCGECRSLARAARLLQSHRTPVPPLSPQFTNAVVAAAQDAHRVQVRQKFLFRGASFVLAASVLLAVWLAWPKPVVTLEPTPFAAVPKTTVTDTVKEAEQAMASLTTKVAEETVTPARNLLFASAETPAPKTNISNMEPLADLPDAAKAGFEPITRTTRKAFDALLRDVNGIAGTNKMKS